MIENIDVGIDIVEINRFKKIFGKPEDVSNMVLYLSSDETKYITGSIFKIDGGQVSKRVVVSNSIEPLNPLREFLGWSANLDSLEKRNVYTGDVLQWISVNYEEATFPYKVFGWTVGWLSFFVGVFLILLPIFKSAAKVY